MVINLQCVRACVYLFTNDIMQSLLCNWLLCVFKLRECESHGVAAADEDEGVSPRLLLCLLCLC